MTIKNVEHLREHYRDPHKAVIDKTRPVVDAKAAEFLAASPFFVLATSSETGVDASPRGGPPGFLVTLDEHHVAFADLSGNNRLDSFTNIVQSGEVGLLCMVPGRDDTLRLNGKATVTTDPGIRRLTAFDGVDPKVAVVIEVTECFIHCAKAFRRSGLWDTSKWDEAGSCPTAGEIIVDQFKLGDFDPKIIDDDLEAGYDATTWVAGGE